MHIGVLGKGAFGSAVSHVLETNGHTHERVDLGDAFNTTMDILVVAVPTQHIRSALIEHKNAYTTETIFVNCAKGAEKSSGVLPEEIIKDVTGGTKYAVLGGPSFASEIMANVPTVVNVASDSPEINRQLASLLNNSHFVVEPISNVLELELAGAMKNIYAVAAGYVVGKGGGENTRAHLQVVALREYTRLVHALEGNNDVVRPAVVGDLILTCASRESRNFQYGLALAAGGVLPDVTAEGVHTAEAIAVLAKKYAVELSLASAVLAVVEETDGAEVRLYEALGFAKLGAS